MERYGGKAREKDHPTEVFIKYPNFVPISLLSVKFVSMFFLFLKPYGFVFLQYIVSEGIFFIQLPLSSGFHPCLGAPIV